MSDYVSVRETLARGDVRGSVVLNGIDVIVSPALPSFPTFTADIVRRVRHGLADVLEWCGEDVGPEPGDPIHVVQAGRRMIVSGDLYELLRRQARS